VKPALSMTYKSNVAKVSADLRKQVAVFIEEAAQEGAAFIRSRSDPHVRTVVTKPQGDANGIITVGVFIPRDEFWATMFDKGTLSKRVVPLKQPGRRRSEWKVRRRGKNGRPVEYTAHRRGEALASGGITPEYFIVRGKRLAEHRLDELMAAWLDPPPSSARSSSPAP